MAEVTNWRFGKIVKNKCEAVMSSTYRWAGGFWFSQLDNEMFYFLLVKAGI